MQLALERQTVSRFLETYRSMADLQKAVGIIAVVVLHLGQSSGMSVSFSSRKLPTHEGSLFLQFCDSPIASRGILYHDCQTGLMKLTWADLSPSLAVSHQGYSSILDHLHSA
jgi:hypothetical protein